jgi:hypothetical protein
VIRGNVTEDDSAETVPASGDIVEFFEWMERGALNVVEAGAEKVSI